MPDAFDPYYLWLGIPPEEQPPSHYRLLTLKLYESNPDVIAGAADRQMAHVRSFQSGKHAAESQRLLNDLSAARLCLLSADKKVSYDQTLKAKLAGQLALAAPPAPPVPVAMVPKPLRVAQPAAPGPMPAEATTAGALDFDPLAKTASPRHRKRRSTAQQPTLVIGVGGALAAIVGLAWLLAGSGSDKPEKSPAKQTAVADRAAHSVDRDDAQSKPGNHAAKPKTAELASGEKSRRLQTPDDDSTGDSTGDAETPMADNEVPDDTESSMSVDGMDEADPASAAVADAFSREPPARETVPDAAAAKGAIADIQKLFKNDFTSVKKSDQKVALAEKLLALAGDSSTPLERFALLSEAKRLASGAGEASLSLRAIEAMAEQFDLDRLELAADMIESFGDKDLPGPARQALVETAAALVGEAAAAGEFALARRLGTAGLAAARKNSQGDAAKAFVRQLRDLATQEKLADAAGEAGEQLESKPDDGQAHLAIGKYLCLIGNDWDQGLLHLKQGSDAALRSVAERESEGAKSAADQAKLGDLWWEVAEQAKGGEKDLLRARAGYWYQRAIGELTGLTKTRIEKRIEDLAANRPPTVRITSITASKIVLWNCHSNRWKDRGTQTCNVQLRKAGKVVWSKQGIQTAWSATAEPPTEIKLPKIAFDSARVEVVSHVKLSGALCEIEILQGRNNIALGKPTRSSGAFSRLHGAANLVDGIKTSAKEAKGYWVLPNHQLGWAEVQLVPTEAATAKIEKPATPAIARKPERVQIGKCYSLDLTVRQRNGQLLSIETKLDDKPFVHWNGQVESLSLWRDWIVPRADVIALAANEPTIFHVVKFKLLSGRATIDKDDGPKASATNPPVSARPAEATGELFKGALLIATFDEPTTLRKNGEVRVRDLSGKQKPGLVVGAEFVPGKSGRALYFRKVGDHVDFGTDPSLNPASFTFCAWVMPAPHGNAWNDVFSKHSEGRGCSGLVVRIDSNQPEFGIGIGDGQWHFLRPGVPIPLEQWSHVAATHDRVSSSIYINGQLAKSAPSDGPVVSSAQPCYIGSTPDRDELQFYGLIDEVALFDRAITADELLQIYQLGVKGKSLAPAGKK